MRSLPGRASFQTRPSPPLVKHNPLEGSARPATRPEPDYEIQGPKRRLLTQLFIPEIEPVHHFEIVLLVHLARIEIIIIVIPTPTSPLALLLLLVSVPIPVPSGTRGGQVTIRSRLGGRMQGISVGPGLVRLGVDDLAFRRSSPGLRRRGAGPGSGGTDDAIRGEHRREEEVGR